MNERLPITENDRERWRQVFACRTPEKIALHPYAGGYQCHGCSGSCGTTNFARDRQLQQPDLFSSALCSLQIQPGMV